MPRYQMYSHKTKLEFSTRINKDINYSIIET
jgi:hypothetical protein